jgi:tetratricopeptide (TPR) repeat protein
MNIPFAQPTAGLQEALLLHREGQLGRAQSIYEAILERQPDHASAWHFLGVIAAQTGNPGRAVELFARAIEIEPNDAGPHCNRALALQQLKEFDAALASCQRAIALNPAFAEAYFNRGNIHRDLGQMAAALASYDQAIAIRADLAEAYSNRGMVLRELGKLQAALASYDRAIEINPRFAEAYSNRGEVLKELKQFAPALASCDKAIELRPDFAEAYSNRANILKELKQWDAALASCNRAIALKPDFAEAYCNRGIVLRGIGQLDAALASYDRAIAMKSDYAEAYANRGIVLKELDQYDAALASCNLAIRIKSDEAGAYATRAVLFHETNQIDAALADYDQAVTLKPDFAEAHVNRSMALLLAGDFDRGWADFEWRWRGDDAPGRDENARSERLWLGRESLVGRTIVLRCEQGLGDTLQFCRFAKRIAALGGSVVLEVQRPLKTLLESLDGVSRLTIQGEALPAFDYQCPLMSLPLALKTTLSTIPVDIPYLKSDPQKMRSWKDKLGESAKLRVGLVWSGGFRHDQPELWAVNKRRNIPLTKLAELKHPEIEFYTLQKGQPAESELAEAQSKDWGGPHLIDHTALLRDFSDTAALIENLDLVISVDTSTAHLAAALGKPVWILNRFDTCWRWLLDRTDSPWYPTVRLYRQSKRENWDGVVSRVRTDLAQLIARRL